MDPKVCDEEPDVNYYIIEKIVKHGTSTKNGVTQKQVKVKWLGYGSEHNQWIDASSIMTIGTKALKPRTYGRKKKAADVPSEEESSNVVEDPNDASIESTLKAVQELQDSSIDSGRSSAVATPPAPIPTDNEVVATPEPTPNVMTTENVTIRRPMKVVNNNSASESFTFASPKVPVAQRGIKRSLNFFSASSDSYTPAKPCPKRFKALLPDQGADGQYKRVNTSSSSKAAPQSSSAESTAAQNENDSSAKKFSFKSILKRHPKLPSTPVPLASSTMKRGESTSGKSSQSAETTTVPTAKVLPRTVSFAKPSPAASSAMSDRQPVRTTASFQVRPVTPSRVQTLPSHSNAGDNMQLPAAVLEEFVADGIVKMKIRRADGKLIVVSMADAFARYPTITNSYMMSKLSSS